MNESCEECPAAHIKIIHGAKDPFSISGYVQIKHEIISTQLNIAIKGAEKEWKCLNFAGLDECPTSMYNNKKNLLRSTFMDSENKSNFGNALTIFPILQATIRCYNYMLL